MLCYVIVTLNFIAEGTKTNQGDFEVYCTFYSGIGINAEYLFGYLTITGKDIVFIYLNLIFINER